MIMAEKPGFKAAFLPYFLQKIRQMIRLICFLEQSLLDGGGRAMGDDIIRLPAVLIQRLTGLAIFLWAGQLLDKGYAFMALG